MPNLTLNFRPETLGAGTPVSIYLPDEITDDMPETTIVLNVK